MATTTPDNIYSPDTTNIYSVVTDSAALAASVQAALIKRSWYYVGTDAQRLALAGAELRNGIIFEDVATGNVWQRKGGAWVSKDSVRNLGSIAPVTTGTQTGIAGTRTKVTGTDVNITLSAPTKLRFYAHFVTQSSSAADAAYIYIMDGATEAYVTVVPTNSSATVANTSRTQTIMTEFMAPAGSHNYSIAILRAVGSGTIQVTPGAKFPTSFSIDRVG